MMPTSSSILPPTPVWALPLLGLLLILSATPTRAWHIDMHAELARIAHSALPAPIQQSLSPYVPELMQGAMAPDLDLLDLPNHFLNIHMTPGTARLAQARIETLYHEIEQQLSQPAADLSQVAFQLGRLSHYLGDINQPLHTDEREGEALMHLEYEDDVWQHMGDITLFDPGIRFRFDPAAEALNSALEANRFYSAVLSPYFEGHGIDDTLGITRLNVQRAAEDIRDTWATLWERARANQPRIALSSSKRRYTPGEAVNLTLSMLINKQARNSRADLCLAVTTESGAISFLNAKSRFVDNPICYLRDMMLNNQSMEVFNALIQPGPMLGEYQVFAVLIKPGSDLMKSSNWLSNLAHLDISIEAPPEIHLDTLADEGYLFPAQVNGGDITPLPLQRWDILFVGNPESRSDAEAAEDLVHKLIPGAFSHILVYLGRDREGTPYALEQAHSLTHEIVALRLVRLPEFSRYPIDYENLLLPLVSKDLWRYRVRGARRLIPSELKKLKENEPALLKKLDQQWHDHFSYQLEYDLSGLADKRIQLVDDGLNNGSGCTDYWLSNFEETANVCIRGSRMNARELTDFYRTDPVVSSTIIPLSEFNPFPFPLPVASVFKQMGFTLIDPPPHVFRCDSSRETGVAVPDRLFDSPQLEAISPDPAVSNWY